MAEQEQEATYSGPADDRLPCGQRANSRNEAADSADVDNTAHGVAQDLLVGNTNADSQLCDVPAAASFAEWAEPPADGGRSDVPVKLAMGKTDAVTSGIDRAGQPAGAAPSGLPCAWSSQGRKRKQPAGTGSFCRSHACPSCKGKPDRSSSERECPGFTIYGAPDLADPCTRRR